MEPFTLLYSFILTCLIIELTPGPNMAYLAILSLREGRISGFMATIGIAFGLLFVGILSAIGVGTLISSSPFLYQSLRILGVCYLFWLAWDGWQLEKETSPGKTNRKESNTKFFRRGFIVNVLNPKAAVFFIAILPQFITTTSNTISQALVLTAIYVTVATTIHIAIVSVAGTIRPFLESDEKQLIVRRGLSLLLALVALWFGLKTAY